MNPEFLYGGTDVGRMRDNNEDAFVTATLGNGRLLACVIDGVGGYEGGEVAAAYAQEAVKELVSGKGDAVTEMKNAIVRANERIIDHRMKHPQLDRMACVLTIAVADTENNSLQFAHVGDTRLYLFRDASLVKLSHDQSFVGYLEDNRKISEEEAMNHPKRNEISKAVGFEPAMEFVADYIETGSSPFLPGDLLLLCSDGLSDLVDSQTMIAILSGKGSLKEKTNALITRANELGGKDNITVVLVQHQRERRQERATRPKLVKKAEPAPPAPATAVPSNARSAPTRTIPAKRGSGLTWFLLFLSLLLGLVAWYFYRQANGQPKGSESPTGAQVQRSPEEQRLLDSLNLAPVLFLDSSFGRTITIHDTLLFRGDSVRIYGSGQVLRADSNYVGPGLAMTGNGRYLMLDNIVLDGFDIGLLVPSGTLQLKNVQFRNCRIPVQYALHLPAGRFISGSLNDSLAFKRDTAFRK